MITLIVAAVSVIVGGFIAKFGEQLFDLTRVKLIQLTRSNGGGFSKNFRGIRPTGTDLMVFTITARHYLPVTDVLYLRFLSWMLRERLAERLVLIVWFQESADAPGEEEWEPYWSFIHHCFESFGDRVEIIDCAKSSPVIGQPVSGLFWRALDHLTSPEYYKWVRHLGTPARALKHMNRARPGDVVLRGLVAHAIQNAHTAPSVLKQMFERAGSRNQDLVLSVLIWELEVDRLAIYYELYDQYKRERGKPGFTLNPVRGVTIRQSRGRAGDNHSEDRAVGLTLSPFEQLDRIARKSRREIRGYVDAASTVLSETYGFDLPRAQWAYHGRQQLDEWSTAERLTGLPKIGRAGHELVFALSELRRRWRPAQAQPGQPA